MNYESDSEIPDKLATTGPGIRLPGRGGVGGVGGGVGVQSDGLGSQGGKRKTVCFLSAISKRC